MNTPDLHSQRPDYQRENIDLALGILENLLSELGINKYTFDPNNFIILFGDLNIEGGSYNWHDDNIQIDFRNSFNIEYYIHEAIHSFASSKRDLKIGRPRNGFSGVKNNFDGFSEGIVESITSQQIMKYKKEIQQIILSQDELRHSYKELGIQAGDIFAESGYGNGTESVHYILEKFMVNCFLDLISYHDQYNSKVSFEEARRKSWKNIQQLFFTGNKKVLFQISQSVDPSGRIWSGIKETNSDSKELDDTSELIIDTIRTKYDSAFIPNFDETLYV